MRSWLDSLWERLISPVLYGPAIYLGYCFLSEKMVMVGGLIGAAILSFTTINLTEIIGTKWNRIK